MRTRDDRRFARTYSPDSFGGSGSAPYVTVGASGAWNGGRGRITTGPVVVRPTPSKRLTSMSAADARRSRSKRAIGRIFCNLKSLAAFSTAGMIWFSLVISCSRYPLASNIAANVTKNDQTSIFGVCYTQRSADLSPIAAVGPLQSDRCRNR